MLAFTFYGYIEAFLKRANIFFIKATKIVQLHGFNYFSFLVANCYITMISKRLLYFILIVLTIPLGIGTRNYRADLPHLIATYGGDVLAATCIFFGIRFLALKTSLAKVAGIAYGVCILLELLQLYQASWMVAIRKTKIGGILLGHGFLWSDWVCYAVGVLLGLLLAYLLERWLTNNK